MHDENVKCLENVTQAVFITAHFRVYKQIQLNAYFQTVLLIYMRNKYIHLT